MGGAGTGLSPGAGSFDESVHGGKTVEERLQALLDRLKESGTGLEVR
jgi:hypothetical protein